MRNSFDARVVPPRFRRRLPAPISRLAEPEVIVDTVTSTMIRLVPADKLVARLPRVVSVVPTATELPSRNADFGCGMPEVAGAPTRSMPAVPSHFENSVEASHVLVARSLHTMYCTEVPEAAGYR